MLFIILCCSAVLAEAQNLGFTLAHGQRKVQIPFELYNNLIVVPVVLNDALPLKFILDTGVRTAILTQKTFTDILNIQYARKYTIAGPGVEKLIEAYVANNMTLELPGIIGRGHALLVLEDDYLELRNYLGTDVHGILGYELFSRFIIQVDYDKKILTFMVPSRFRRKKKFQMLPMKIEDTKPYIITPIELEDGTIINAKLLMDSGASHGLLLDPESDKRIKVPQHSVSSIIGRGLGGEIVGKVGRIKSINMGTHKLENVIVNFPDPNSYSDTLKTSHAFRNGSMGGEVMSRMNIVFNFPQEEFYFKKNKAFKRAFHYNLSGLIVKAKGAQLNVFEITEVRTKSAAEEAGILPGDIILSLNGVGSSLLNLNMINTLFNSKPDKKIRMEISRNGERIRREFLLKDQI